MFLAVTGGARGRGRLLQSLLCGLGLKEERRLLSSASGKDEKATTATPTATATTTVPVSALSPEMVKAIKENVVVYPSSSTDPHIFLAQKEAFGYFKGGNTPTGRKVLRKPLIGDRLVEYYPDGDIKFRRAVVSLLKKQREEFAEAGNEFAVKLLDARIAITRRTPRQRYQALRMTRLRRRGKGPPKKGFGKRAGKRKKK